MAASRTFVDTNVLVYAVDPADPRKRDIATAITPERRQDQLVISTQVLLELFSALTRKLRPGLPAEEAEAVVADLAGVRPSPPMPRSSAPPSR